MSLIETLLMQSDEGRTALRQQTLLVDVSEKIWSELQSQNVTISELANKLGISKSDVSQKISGKRNLTLKTLSDIANALGHDVNIELKPQAEKWIASGPVESIPKSKLIIKPNSDIKISSSWSDIRKAA